jgi:16S rRNA (guanine527-N7)-methyltransferase
MDPARIVPLLQPFFTSSYIEDRAVDGSAELSPIQLHSISTYIDILLRWNSKINLTAIRDPEQIVTRHFGESLFAARHLFPANTQAMMGGPFGHVSDFSGSGRAGLQGRVKSETELGACPPVANHQRPTTNAQPSLADIGSGAGFPGIPIKLWAPHISLTLIESNHKKATFLREVARALRLTDINIQDTRAETVPPASFDVVTLRAVERFASILPIVANLVAPGGRLALLIGATQLDSASQTLGNDYLWFEPQPIPSSTARVLAIARRRTLPVKNQDR